MIKNYMEDCDVTPIWLEKSRLYNKGKNLGGRRYDCRVHYHQRGMPTLKSQTNTFPLSITHGTNILSFLQSIFAQLPAA